MKVLILTTESKHHTYFIMKLFKKFEVVGLVYERRRIVKDYPTGPIFEAEEQEFEERFFDKSLDGVSRDLPANLMERTIEVHSVNQRGFAAYIRALEPDVAIAFGVGFIMPSVFSIPHWGTINVHRGIAEEYRGLDSDLWAIYHKRFDQIGVTVHYVDKGLDTGDVLAQEHISIEPRDEIFHLRYKTTLGATRLVSSVLSEFAERGGPLEGESQRRVGAYYSSMPLDLKQVAQSYFCEFKESLNA